MRFGFFRSTFVMNRGLILGLGCRELAVQAGDMRDGDRLGAFGLAGTRIGAVAEAQLVHLGDHCFRAACAFDAALRQFGQRRHAGCDEQHRRSVLAGGGAGSATHAGVGAINESDILLASTANAIVVGFNVRPDAAAQASAQRANVDIRMYRVIYDAIDEIEAAMKGMLAPKYREAIIGHAEVRQTYKVSAIGTIAGCYVKDGKVTRDSKVRVLRDNIVIYEGEIGSLQRFKDSVKEVAAGYECGMSIEKYNDIKEGDIFECFVMEQIKD